MDAVDLLTRQHRELESLLAAAAADALSPADREAHVARAADFLATHVTAEERLFYPAVRAKRTEDILLESLEEHLSLKRLLADLLRLSPADPTFVPKYNVLKEQCEHHHHEEEEHLFPKVIKLLDDAQREALGGELTVLMDDLTARGSARNLVLAQTVEAAPLT